MLDTMIIRRYASKCSGEVVQKELKKEDKMRLDISEPEALEWVASKEISIDNSPIDLCFHCAHNEAIADMAEVEHPSYDDDTYNCVVCGCLLDDVNDG